MKDEVKKVIKEILKSEHDPLFIAEEEKYYGSLSKSKTFGNISIAGRDFKMNVYKGLPVLYCEERHVYIISEENKKLLGFK